MDSRFAPAHSPPTGPWATPANVVVVPHGAVGLAHSRLDSTRGDDWGRAEARLGATCPHAHSPDDDEIHAWEPHAISRVDEVMGG